MQFQTLLPHLGSSSEKTNSRFNLNRDFLELEFILASSWNLLSLEECSSQLHPRVQWVAIPSREQATETSLFAEHPALNHAAWDLGWIPIGFNRHFSQWRLRDTNRTTAMALVNMLLLEHCSYETSVLYSVSRRKAPTAKTHETGLLEMLGVKETSAYLCSQHLCLAC